MWRKKIVSYSSILLVYLVVISFLRWQWSWRWAFFWLGGFVGLGLFNLDHLVYLLWQAPEDEHAPELKRRLKEKKIVPVLDFLSRTAGSRKKLVAHSVVFQVVLVVLGFFALTSTVGIFGKGMMMGLFLYPLLVQGERLLKGKRIDGWFWQVEQVPPFRDQALYYCGMLLVFLIFSWLLI